MGKNGTWKIKVHNSQIADTGDYDGHYELTNGTISLVTKDDIDTEDSDNDSLKQAMSILNGLDIKWENWDLSDAKFELHLEKENCKKWKEVAKDLYESIGGGSVAAFMACGSYLQAVDNLP